MSEAPLSSDELREARRLWLDAETRLLAAQAALVRSEQRCFELQQQLITQATQHMCDIVAAPWVALAAEIRSKL